MKTALANELSKLVGHQIAGGSVDVYKCFDQINRKLLYKIAEAAGMPKRILDPYFNYIDNLRVRYQIGKTIGKAHTDRCSIPQGCPFSMTMIALMLRPWIKMMEFHQVEPRVLADDLMFTAKGVGHRAKTIDAMQSSRTYFADMGAKVANNKCFTFATDKDTRKHLSDYNWDLDGLRIPNLSSFRDLGAHMNLTNNVNGSTLTMRIKKATKMAQRLKWLPVTREVKNKIVLCNIIPAALYGVEITQINRAAMQSLRSAIADAVGPASAKRSVDLVFNTTNTGKDLDPEVHSLYLRAANLRRIMAKHSSTYGQVVAAIRKYNHAECNDTDGDDDDSYNIKYKQFMALQTKYDKATLWHQISTQTDNFLEHEDDAIEGPVGLLMQSLKACGCSLDQQFNIRASGEPTINMWEIPWQHLKTAIFGIGARSRNKRIQNDRTFCGQFDEIDQPILDSTWTEGAESICAYLHRKCLG